MPRDEDFHELATRFPEVALAAAGIVAAPGDYRVASLELKKSALRVDLAFLPRRRGLPYVLGEVQRRRDRDVERTALRKAVNFVHEHPAARGRARVVIVYARRALARRVHGADIGPRDDLTVAFSPRRVVLPDLRPEPLERRGGAARILLPLVGTEREVLERATEWERALRENRSFVSEEERWRAHDLFLRMLMERLRRLVVEKLLPEEAMIERTATGRSLIRRGMRKGLKKGLEKGLEKGIRKGRVEGRAEGRAEALRTAILEVLRARFGRVPAALTRKLADVEDVKALQRGLGRAARMADRTEMNDLLDT